MSTAAELAGMREAVALSALGLGTTSPNPPVGCVILDQAGHRVGAGFHQRKGEPHAETHALAAAGARARGGTALVTLEPCNHTGITPACRQALLDAEVARVVIAVLDPTSRGPGGAAVLADAGVDVHVGLLADEALVVLEPWLTATTRGRPHVTWTFMSDGTLKDPALATVTASLRTQADLVVFGSDVEEGIPGGHGKDRFDIPCPPLAMDADTLLGEMFTMGARSVLFVGDLPRPRALLDLGAVDWIVAVARRVHSLGDSQAHVDWSALDRYDIVGVTGHRHFVAVEARRARPKLVG